MTIATVLKNYQVDLEHAYHVTDLAVTMFYQSQPMHGLSERARRLLEIGALLHNVGLTTDQAQHHLIGRDIVLDSDLLDLSDDERAMVACLVAFHRKRVEPEREPAFLRLSKKQQQLVLRLAALLRIADGLDYSQTQTTRIQACKVGQRKVRLQVVGPHADQDGPRALEKADLWKTVFDREIKVTPEVITLTIDAENAKTDATVTALSEPTAVESSEPRLRQLMTSHDTLTETVRRLLRQNFQRLLTQEQKVLGDTDVRSVHEMRVATRRLRALLLIGSEVAPFQEVRTFRKSIQQIARAAADVRDCDVLREHVERYRETLPPAECEGLATLFKRLERDRSKARTRLQTYLATPAYTSFKRSFATFLTDNASDWNTQLRLRDLAGSVIWHRYEQLREYERDVDFQDLKDTDEELLHEMRITGKRLRYLLEIASALPDIPTDDLLKPLVDLQDCLGGLQDIAVAKAYMATIDGKAESKAAIERYLAHREEERATLFAQVPGHWERITSVSYRRVLAELLVTL
ncbi:MAG: CHAD domain-containing protein [Chloroflexaceae bacterium]|nr:CHAD domain-containing protein [Chloroflexaceae bacterium]